MRILVVEDKESHREAAQTTLAGHDVTIVESFDEAVALMARKIDKENVERLLADAGFPAKPSVEDKTRYHDYWKAHNEAEAKSVIPFPFEVVLTDMMMPMSRRTLAPGVFEPGEQVPYGLIIALKATLCGAKFVAMITDTNHHHGAMSAALDHLGTPYYQDGFQPNFVINGARVMFVHAPFCREVLGTKLCESCQGSGSCDLCQGTGQRQDLVGGPGECNGCRKADGKCKDCKGSGTVDDVRCDRKDWGRVLTDLTA